ncbi:MAG: site-2 protease family protein, partial [Pseudorhodobacter sp.]
MFKNDRAVFLFHTRFGFPVEIRQSIVMLALFYLLFATRSAQGLIDALIMVTLIMTAIFLHEMGHAWGCRVYGIEVRRVVIFGGGGFCEHRASSYKQDELIVAMGPIVNLGLWALASMLANWAYGWMEEDAPFWQYELFYWIDTFGFLNLALFFFNMVPVQPLDGGRLFHILMRRMMPPLAAMRVAGAVGVVFSVLWWPGLFLLFMTTGWLLFFAPS